MSSNDAAPCHVSKTLLDLGEKRLLEEHILPLVNPEGVPGLAGDDFGVLEASRSQILASTDRVPWNLTAHRLGLMSKRQLGYYLAVLNISDVAAMGGVPRGLLVNCAFPPTFLLEDLLELYRGILRACADYSVVLIGGDLSDSAEPSLCATIVGDAYGLRPIYRSPVIAGDVICTSADVGLTATAFAYFNRAQPRGMAIPSEWEALLRSQLTEPSAQIELGRELAALKCRRAAMDNTDGLGQTVMELAAASGVGAIIDSDLLPVHPASHEVARFLGMQTSALVLGAGADFKLVATVEDPAEVPKSMRLIGEVTSHPSTVLRRSGEAFPLPSGWNYFIAEET